MSVHLQREIEKLKKMCLWLSARVEENVQKAARAISDRDEGLAVQVIESDEEIDEMEVEVEEECLKILALHQPVAADLRFIVAVLKLNNDLERIGDLAVNTAKRAIELSRLPEVAIPFDLSDQVHKARQMLKKSLDALVNMDAKLAREVCVADSDVDAIYREMYEQVKAVIARDPSSLDAMILLLRVSRNIERTADHATNIAEDVIYMVRGEIIRHHRKGSAPGPGQGAE